MARKQKQGPMPKRKETDWRLYTAIITILTGLGVAGWIYLLNIQRVEAEFVGQMLR